MNHKPYFRISENSKYAVLLIHGICGTPNHFRELIPLIPGDWSVYNILLDGHGGDVADFGRTSMKKWKTQVSAQLNEIFLRHEQVVLVGHSMGTLFSIQAALDHPARIAGLFLLAVPIRIHFPLSTMLTCLRVAWGNLRPDDTAALAMANDTGIRLDRRLWRYVPWTPRFLELLAECRRIRKLLPRLQVPSRSFQSLQDELVSLRACRDLEANSRIQNTRLPHSGHFAYGAADLALIKQIFSQLIEEICSSG